MDFQAEKERIRNAIKNQRHQLDADSYRKSSQKICDLLLSWDTYKKASAIHCYGTIRKNHEVDTTSILENILGSGKMLIMSKIRPDYQLEYFFVDDLELLRENKMGIPEPQSGKRAQPSDADMIIVPLLAADENGNRLGYGAGYYDRFLSGTNAIKAGLCPERFLLPEIPAEIHDQKLSVIITEKRIILVADSVNSTQH